MLTLVNELLTLATSQQALPTDHEEEVDLTDLAGRLERTFQPEAVERGLTFEVRAGDNLPVLRGNRTLVEQMLENLTSNAIKYTPAGGRVEVVLVREPGPVARIEVRDTGLGIPEADRPQLFTEFFRAANARAFEREGTGLGLAIVTEVVDRLGGRIEVSGAEGAGTTFVVELPAADGERGRTGSDEPQPASRSNSW